MLAMLPLSSPVALVCYLYAYLIPSNIDDVLNLVNFKAVYLAYVYEFQKLNMNTL